MSKIRIKPTLFWISIISFLVLSCSKKEINVFEFIPENATAVVTVNPGSLYEKGRIDELNSLENQMGGDSIFKALIENPEISGINIKAYSAIFMFGEGSQYISMISPVEDEKALGNFIKNLEKEMDIPFEYSKDKGFNFASAGSSSLVWNESVFIVMSMKNGFSNVSLNEKIIEIANLEKEQTVLLDKDFNNFVAKQKDINLWINSSNVPQLKVMGGVLNMFGGIKNNYGQMYLDFQDGFMSLTTNLRFNHDIKATIDKYNFLDKNAIKELLEYIPSKDLFFVANTSISPDKLNSLLKFINDDYDQSMNEIEKELNLEPNDLKKIFSGEIAFSINGIKTGKVNAKNFEKFRFILATRLKNKIIFNKFIELAKQKTEVVEKDGYYIIIEDEFPLYMTLNNNDLVVSSVEEIILEISSKGKIKENVTKAEFSEILTKNPVCFFLNLDRETYPEEINDFIDKEGGSGLNAGMETFGKALHSLTFSANLEEWEFRIDLNNNSENSLYTFLKQSEKN
jgi:Domain of unknown function (DUF4836)